MRQKKQSEQVAGAVGFIMQGVYGTTGLYKAEEELSKIGLDCTNKELLAIIRNACPEDATYFRTLDTAQVCDVFMALEKRLSETEHRTPHDWDKLAVDEITVGGGEPSRLRMDIDITDRQFGCLRLAYRHALHGESAMALHEFMAAVDNFREPERRITWNEASLYRGFISEIVFHLQGRFDTAMHEWGTPEDYLTCMQKACTEGSVWTLSVESMLKLAKDLQEVVWNSGEPLHTGIPPKYSATLTAEQMDMMLELGCMTSTKDMVKVLDGLHKYVSDTCKETRFTQNEGIFLVKMLGRVISAFQRLAEFISGAD